MEYDMVVKRSAKYFLDSNGKEPAKDWLTSLSDKMVRAKVMARISRAENGNWGDYRSVGHGIYELRIHFGPGYRIYFAIDGKDILLLLLGGNKSSQSRDILTARLYWHQYQSGKNL